MQLPRRFCFLKAQTGVVDAGIEVVVAVVGGMLAEVVVVVVGDAADIVAVVLDAAAVLAGVAAVGRYELSQQKKSEQSQSQRRSINPYLG